MLMTSLKVTNSLEDTLVLIDANARTGSIESGAIGRIAPVKENDNGMRFRLCMDNHGLAALNTHCGEGSSTWTSSKNK